MRQKGVVGLDAHTREDLRGDLTGGAQLVLNLVLRFSMPYQGCQSKGRVA